MKLAKKKNTKYMYVCIYISGFPDGAVVKNLLASAGDARDVGLIPE